MARTFSLPGTRASLSLSLPATQRNGAVTMINDGNHNRNHNHNTSNNIKSSSICLSAEDPRASTAITAPESKRKPNYTP
jgi:hypothetical protein